MIVLITPIVVGMVASQPNATIQTVLQNKDMLRNAHMRPSSIAQETAQLMLLELNETTVSNQFGTYPDALSTILQTRFGLMNASSIQQVKMFGAACPRGGPGNMTALIYQHIFGMSEALMYLGVMITCNSIYWHLSFGSTIHSENLYSEISHSENPHSNDLIQVDRVIVNATSTGPVSDPLALLTAVAVGRYTGLFPKPPPAKSFTKTLTKTV